jgi:hypothetical protein
MNKAALVQLFQLFDYLNSDLNHSLDCESFIFRVLLHKLQIWTIFLECYIIEAQFTLS